MFPSSRTKSSGSTSNSDRVKYRLSILLLVSAGRLLAQEDLYPHPELDWFTIETQHFLVHYHNGTERSAREVARIAEEIYKPITDLYQHEPDQKVSFVVIDHDDYSNGAAYFYDNKIEIWAPALDFELRGTHPWLRDVVTHEFTHIVQIQTAMKLGRKFPAIYFQWLGYEAERRTDVLYGYPNIIVSYPLSAFVVPSWFAEGVAQYNHPDLTYDYWDSHRDMILRMYMLDGNPLTWDQMAVFGKTSLGNESSYNAGFSIVHYIAETYGVDKLEGISRALASLPRVTVDGAIEAVLGKSGGALYDEWKKVKTEHYRASTAHLAATKVEGVTIEEEGFGNSYPVFSPDGKTIAYVSNKGEDYFGLSSVYRYDPATGIKKKLRGGVRSTLSFSPDGRFLFYSKTSWDNPHWSRLSDLYRYDLEKEDEERLTHGWRAWNPRLSPDGTKIVFVTGSDGTTNIGVADADGKNFVLVTHFKEGEQVYTPSWSPEGKSIAFGYSHGHKQSVAVCASDGSGFRILTARGDARNPVFSSDGQSLYYASDESGIFNLYRHDLQEGVRGQLTSVLGGAFMPAVNKEGDVVFASYTSSGYKIAFLSKSSPVAEMMPAVQLAGSSTASPVDTDGIGQSEIDTTKAKPYRNVFSSLSLIPLLRVDNYNPRNKGIDIIRPGFYFASSDMLNKLSLFGSAAINRKFERDLFFIFEYRDAVPLLYQLGLEPVMTLELYNISRKADVTFDLFTDRQHSISTDVTYNLLEFDITMRQKIISEENELKLAYTLSRYNADVGSFLIPSVGVSQGFRNEYLIGNTFSAHLRHESIHPTVDRDINPVGRTISLRYTYESDKFNPESEYEIENGLLVPQYTNPQFQRLETGWNEHLALPFKRHTLTLSLRRNTSFNKRLDDFFDFYIGGFTGMRGYPFYALGGSEVATASLNYRFPIMTGINTRFLQFYFTKLYGSVFGDIGEAWRGSTPALKHWKTDAGFELRLEAFSFYQYPTRIFFSGAYGFDRFTRTFNNVPVTYGKEWRFYLGVLFGFELNQSRRMFEKSF
ncbi:MAG: PD40 domain-containing protein [Ignavibacteriales bacterium]|nr:PD40 domain-containing protein [Ignavibacteriales bacterium]